MKFYSFVRYSDWPVSPKLGIFEHQKHRVSQRSLVLPRFYSRFVPPFRRWSAGISASPFLFLLRQPRKSEAVQNERY